MTGGSGRDKGAALAKVPTVRGWAVPGVGGRRTVTRGGRALGGGTAGRAGLYTLVIAADPVRAFEAWGICDER